MPKKAAAKKAPAAKKAKVDVSDDESDEIVSKFIEDVTKREEDKSSKLVDNLKSVTLYKLDQLIGWDKASEAKKQKLISAILAILPVPSDASGDEEEEEEEKEEEEIKTKGKEEAKAKEKGEDKMQTEGKGGTNKRKRRQAKPGCVLVSDCIKVHKAIHDYPKVQSVTISTGDTIDIGKGSNGCRKATVANVTFMEQNTKKPSTFAKQAKMGHKITWVLYMRKWGMLCDGRVEIDCPLFDHDGSDDYVEEEEEEQRATTTTTSSSPALPPSAKKSELKKEDSASDTHLLSLSISFPNYWENPNNKTTARIALDASSGEFKKLAAMLIKTSGTNIEVSKITRLQNPVLWMRYFLKRQHVAEINNDKPDKISYVLTELLDNKTNEYFFYHGCNPTVVDKIIDGGFDERLGSLSGLFGSGIYFAENSAKSISYTHTAKCKQIGANYGGSVCTCQGSKDARNIFISRAVLGTPWIRLVHTDKSNPMRRPPERPNGTLYDSVMGESKSHDKQASLPVREYIVYDRHQTYPEYLVEFNLK